MHMHQDVTQVPCRYSHSKVCPCSCASYVQRLMCREALSVKQCVHVRITGLPWASDSVGRQAAPDLGSIRSAHVGRLLCMRATVLRATAVQMLERQRTYACKKCKHRCASAVIQCTHIMNHH